MMKSSFSFSPRDTHTQAIGQEVASSGFALTDESESNHPVRRRIEKYPKSEAGGGEGEFALVSLGNGKMDMSKILTANAYRRTKVVAQ